MEEDRAVSLEDAERSLLSLNAHPDQFPKYIEKFITRSAGQDTNAALLWTLYIICGGNPKEVAQKLLRQTKSGVCGMVWKSGQTAYKCRTCELDPTWYGTVSCVCFSLDSVLLCPKLTQ